LAGSVSFSIALAPFPEKTALLAVLTLLHQFATSTFPEAVSYQATTSEEATGKAAAVHAARYSKGNESQPQVSSCSQARRVGERTVSGLCAQQQQCRSERKRRCALPEPPSAP
jgi:hypothetical protein